MARKTDLAALLAPLKGYTFTVIPSIDGGIEAITIGDGTVDQYIGAQGAYLMDGHEAVHLLSNGFSEWCLQIGRQETRFVSSPAAAVKRVLKLVKALEEAGLVSKPIAEFRPYIGTCTADGERIYTYIFPA